MRAAGVGYEPRAPGQPYLWHSSEVGARHRGGRGLGAAPDLSRVGANGPFANSSGRKWPLRWCSWGCLRPLAGGGLPHGAVCAHSRWWRWWWRRGGCVGGRALWGECGRSRHGGRGLARTVASGRIWPLGDSEWAQLAPSRGLMGCLRPLARSGPASWGCLRPLAVVVVVAVVATVRMGRAWCRVGASVAALDTAVAVSPALSRGAGLMGRFAPTRGGGRGGGITGSRERRVLCCATVWMVVLGGGYTSDGLRVAGGGC